MGGAVRICLKFLLTTELTYRDCLLWQVWKAFSSPQEENLQRKGSGWGGKVRQAGTQARQRCCRHGRWQGHALAGGRV